jgi:hypothetical protein
MLAKVYNMEGSSAKAQKKTSGILLERGRKVTFDIVAEYWLTWFLQFVENNLKVMNLVVA